jgi:hypothetical protein
MSKFITVTNSRESVLTLNVDHIILIQKETDSNGAIIFVTPYAGNFDRIHVEDYYEVMALIEE